MGARGDSKARSGSAFTAALVGIVAASSITPACSSLQPEVGERLAACVDADSNPGAPVDFKTQIRPIMNGDVPGPKACASCHYETRGTKEGLLATQLNLETLLTLKAGGTGTRDDIVVPGKPCSSAIVQKLRGTYPGARMPKGGPYWAPEQIQLMIDWIAEGAKGANTD